MALRSKVVGRSLGLLKSTQSVKVSPPRHTFVTTRPSITLLTWSRSITGRELRRALTTSSKRGNAVQQAPSAQAYIQNGVLSGKKNLVDVKKVLVIGSGGLSIGQAGEFDYSGTCC